MKKDLSPLFNFFNLLRVLFALIVFSYHLSYDRYGKQLSFLYKLDLGHYAVAGFLFISGFFITHLLKSEMTNSAFIKNRFFRIYPILILCLILTFLMDKLGSAFVPGLYSEEVYNSHNFIGQFSQTALMINQFWNNNVRFGTNGPLWSLSYEVWYYILIFIFFRGGKFKFLALLPILLIMGPNLWLLLPCYILGSVFYIYKDHIPKISPLALPILLILIIVQWIYVGEVIMHFMSQYEWHDLYHLRYSLNFISDLIFTILLLILSAGFYQNWSSTKNYTSKFWKLINHLSKRTYTFYLFHYPMLIFITAAWISTGHEAGSNTALILTACLTMITCYFFGFVETKFLRGRNEKA